MSVILDTDARSKCDKYIHLGMELAGTRRLGEYGVLYDLIKYPDRSSRGENAGDNTRRNITVRRRCGSNLKIKRSGVDTCRTVSYNGAIVFMR